MLAVFGFTVAGIFFALFAYTFNSLVLHKTRLKLAEFSFAYYCLALALLVWGFAAKTGGPALLSRSVVFGDGMLLLGTLFMLYIWLGKKHRMWIYHFSLIAAFLLYLRVNQYWPKPYMQNSILIFNTQQSVALVLVLIIALVWLPVNIKVAKQITHKIGQDTITGTYSAIYIAATISALVFIESKKTATVILSFTALSICFAMLIGSNVLVDKLGVPRGSGKHAK